MAAPLALVESRLATPLVSSATAKLAAMTWLSVYVVAVGAVMVIAGFVLSILRPLTEAVPVLPALSVTLTLAL